MPSVDFYTLKLRINYNSLPLDTVDPPGRQDDDENGWDEKYYFPQTPGIDVVRPQARALVAARCALLPDKFYIFDAGLHQASVYRSLFDLNGYARHPVNDTDEPPGSQVEECNDVDIGMKWRFEDGQGRRWNRVFRGLRDGWGGDMDLAFGNFFYDKGAGWAAPQTPQATGTPATAVAVLTGTSVTSVTGLPSGSGYVNTPRLIFVGGGGMGASATAVVTSGVVTGITGLVGGTGYTSPPTVYIDPPQAEPWGLPPNQTPSALIQNFLLTLANWTINFIPVRVTNAGFPSGKCTQASWVSPASGPYTVARILAKGLAKHDTGMIRRSKKGRKKHAI